MNTAKSFHLRWNNHLTNLRSLLEYLYNEQSFVDVTLSCKDGLIRAHKLVLSACSPYFDTIFRENPCKHPTVILRGVSLREMQLIIEYMYIGSVDVPEEDLHALLNTASELHVKGLVQSKSATSSSNVENSNGSHTKNEQCTKSIKSESKEDINESNYTNDVNNSECEMNGMADSLFMNDAQNMSFSGPTNNDAIDENGMMDLGHANMDDAEVAIQNMQYNLTGHNVPSNDGVGMLCKICNRSFINKQNMKRHMQTHSGEKPHKCDLCSLSFLRLSHLQRHLRVHTGERPFGCDQCDKQFSRSDKLKHHVAMHHSGFVPVKQQKQRGRPRKESGNANTADYMIPMADVPSQSEYDENNCENTAPSFHSLQQVYNIQSPMLNSGVSVAQ